MVTVKYPGEKSRKGNELHYYKRATIYIYYVKQNRQSLLSIDFFLFFP